jgi:hypothetical protein
MSPMFTNRYLGKKYQSTTDFAQICVIGDRPTVAQPDGYYYVTVPVYATYY